MRKLGSNAVMLLSIPLCQLSLLIDYILDYNDVIQIQNYLYFFNYLELFKNNFHLSFEVLFSFYKPELKK